MTTDPSPTQGSISTGFDDGHRVGATTDRRAQPPVPMPALNPASRLDGESQIRFRSAGTRESTEQHHAAHHAGEPGRVTLVLGVTHLDTAEVDPNTPTEETIGALADLVAEGKVLRTTRVWGRTWPATCAASAATGRGDLDRSLVVYARTHRRRLRGHQYLAADFAKGCPFNP